MQQISQKLISGLFVDVMKWTAVHIKWRGMSIESVCECECSVQYILLWIAWLSRSVYQGNTLYFPNLNNCIYLTLQLAT